MFDGASDQPSGFNGLVAAPERVTEKAPSVQIVDTSRDVNCGEGRTRTQWLKRPVLYKVRVYT